MLAEGDDEGDGLRRQDRAVLLRRAEGGQPFVHRELSHVVEPKTKQGLGRLVEVQQVAIRGD